MCVRVQCCAASRVLGISSSTFLRFHYAFLFSIQEKDHGCWGAGGDADGGVWDCFHVEVVSFSRRIVSSRIPFVSSLYFIVFKNMKNTVRIQSTRYVLTHALYHQISNTV